MSKIEIDILNIILNIIFIPTFVIIFYLFWGLYIEKYVIYRQLNEVMLSLKDDLLLILPTEYQNSIKSFISQIKLKNIQLQEKKIELNNKIVIFKTIAILILILIIGLIIALIIAKHANIELFDKEKKFYGILGQNMLIIVFIILFEFCILTFLLINFKSADPNVIKKSIISTLVEFLYGKTLICTKEFSYTSWDIFKSAFGLN